MISQKVISFELKSVKVIEQEIQEWIGKGWRVAQMQINNFSMDNNYGIVILEKEVLKIKSKLVKLTPEEKNAWKDNIKVKGKPVKVKER